MSVRAQGRRKRLGSRKTAKVGVTLSASFMHGLAQERVSAIRCPPPGTQVACLLEVDRVYLL